MENSVWHETSPRVEVAGTTLKAETPVFVPSSSACAVGALAISLPYEGADGKVGMRSDVRTANPVGMRPVVRPADGYCKDLVKSQQECILRQQNRIDELLALTAQFHSLPVVENKCDDCSWEKHVLAQQPTIDSLVRQLESANALNRSYAALQSSPSMEWQHRLLEMLMTEDGEAWQTFYDPPPLGVPGYECVGFVDGQELKSEVSSMKGSAYVTTPRVSSTAF